MEKYENFKDTCVVCQQKFTDDRPCCCDGGQTPDGKLHYHGHCVECCPLHSETARAERKTKTTERAPHWDEEAYQRHLALEGNNTWNAHPDGCYHCGSCEHHSQDCPDRDFSY